MSGVNIKVGIRLMLLNVLVNILFSKFVRENNIVVSISVKVMNIYECIWNGIKNSEIVVIRMLINRLCVMLLLIYLVIMMWVGIGVISSFLILCWNLVLKNDDVMLV